jgi:hypothetical protein
MDDQTQRPGPDQHAGSGHVIEPDEADAEGHRFSGNAIPDAPGPDQHAGTGHVIEPDEADTVGHRYSGWQPAPAIPGQPAPGEAAVDDDTEGHAGCVNH